MKDQSKTMDIDKILNGFNVDTEQRMPHRVAHFLMYASKVAEGRYWPYNVILKAVMGYKHMPRNGTEEVKAVQRTMSTTKRELQRHKFGFHYKAHLGVCALFNDNLKASQQLTTAVRRSAAAQHNVNKVVSIIDPSKLNAANAAYFDNVSTVFKSIESRMVKCLPPGAKIR